MHCISISNHIIVSHNRKFPRKVWVWSTLSSPTCFVGFYCNGFVVRFWLLVFSNSCWNFPRDTSFLRIETLWVGKITIFQGVSSWNKNLSLSTHGCYQIMSRSVVPRVVNYLKVLWLFLVLPKSLLEPATLSFNIFQLFKTLRIGQYFFYFFGS